ncbi:hypothetical protein [Kitasatospora sp. CB01950]|uniref:hypothetical protein n=1 Tax=Kitasatospora sp. CB01950 TaxID=1703930 RepID=UPI00093A76C0|nr:hypothetical protein [Kitasatospora sp. CB01950]OKJ15760.1 hypothetical protein AMK19_05710 [Kitasatospora sp. CB01950]
MTGKRRSTTFADLVAALPTPPEDEPEVRFDPMPVHDRGFTDADGCHWRLVRGPLDVRRAERLAVTADRMTMGVDYDERVRLWMPRFLGAEERPAAWPAARAGFDAAALPFHEAYEFADDDGRVLLFIETHC